MFGVSDRYTVSVTSLRANGRDEHQKCSLTESFRMSMNAFAHSVCMLSSQSSSEPYKKKSA